MKRTRRLQEMGQSLWLDNITRGLLTSGVLRRYAEELSVTGLTSNPTIFHNAIKNSHDYDDAIGKRVTQESGESLFFELALEDLRQAADLFRPVHDRTRRVDGWVSLEVSPLLAHDTARTVAAVKELHARAERPNLFIKIPGTREGLPAIEESIFAGLPINVTLLFSREQYVAAAEAYWRGIERRVASGLTADVFCVASIFVSRWDVAVAGTVPEALRNRLGIAIAKRAYRAYRELLDSPRRPRPLNAGAQPQRLLWASTGTRTRRPPTCSTSSRWPPRSRSIRSPRPRSRRWRTMARSERSCPPTAVTARRFSPASPGPVSTSTRSRPSSRMKVPVPS
jgi:transaldolase